MPVSLDAAILAVYAQGTTSSYYGPFARSLYKNVWTSLVTDSRWNVTPPDANLSPAKLTMTCSYSQNAQPWKDLSPGVCRHSVLGRDPFTDVAFTEGAIIEKLELVLRFLDTTIFGPATQDDDFVDVKRSFFRVIGGNWEDLSKSIIAEYLSTVIPDEPSQFGAFGAVADRCRKFEDWLVDIGMFSGRPHVLWMWWLTRRNAGMIGEDQRYLSDYCAQMDVHFAQRKHTKLLRVARDILLLDDHETVNLDEKEPEGKTFRRIHLRKRC